MCCCYRKVLLMTCVTLSPDIEECASAPCHNNGSCMDLRNGYNCSCKPGYTGVNCEKGKLVIQPINNNMYVSS